MVPVVKTPAPDWPEGRRSPWTSGLGLGLLETQAAVAFLPLSSFHEKVDPLEPLEDVAPRGDLALAFK